MHLHRSTTLPRAEAMSAQQAVSPSQAAAIAKEVLLGVEVGGVDGRGKEKAGRKISGSPKKQVWYKEN